MIENKFRIIEKKNLWMIISLIAILLGFIFMIERAFKREPVLNFGIDFIGGTTMSFKMDELEKRTIDGAQKQKSSKEINLQFMSELRNFLKTYSLEKSSIQITEEKEIIIKTLPLTPDQTFSIRKNLEKTYGHVDILEIDFIGPSIGEELKRTSLWIIAIVSAALLLYITWRFEFIFGIAAILATLHDALITFSFASIAQIEINTAFVAAILAILGYSINDTIVIFDRIRENLKIYGKNEKVSAIVNFSIQQTLTRTFYTALTTLFVVFCLILFGGTTIKPFSLVLFVGIAVGTYSSICVAAPLFVALSPRSEVKS